MSAYESILHILKPNLHQQKILLYGWTTDILLYIIVYYELFNYDITITTDIYLGQL